MSTLLQVGGLPFTGANIGFLQPKQQNKWRAVFIGFGQNAAPTNDLSIQVKKLGRPNLEFKTHEQHRYNSNAKILGKHTIGDLTMTFEDDISNRASSLIQSQLQRQQFVIGAEGDFLAASQEGSMYKFAVRLEMLNGNSVILESWRYEGCAIKNAKWGDLDYANSEQISIDLTMTVDHMYQEFDSRVAPGQALGGA